MAAVCGPPVGPLKAHDTEPKGIPRWRGFVTSLPSSQKAANSVKEVQIVPKASWMQLFWQDEKERSPHLHKDTIFYQSK